jgi:hypothetical protein
MMKRTANYKILNMRNLLLAGIVGFTTISLVNADYPRQFDWRQRQFVVSSVKS